MTPVDAIGWDRRAGREVRPVRRPTSGEDRARPARRSQPARRAQPARRSQPAHRSQPARSRSVAAPRHGSTDPPRRCRAVRSDAGPTGRDRTRRTGTPRPMGARIEAGPVGGPNTGTSAACRTSPRTRQKMHNAMPATVEQREQVVGDRSVRRSARRRWPSGRPPSCSVRCDTGPVHPWPPSSGSS